MSLLRRIKTQIAEVSDEVRFLTDPAVSGFITESDPVFPTDRVAIFTLHGVEPGFEAQMEYLARHGYRTIQPVELMAILERRAPVPPKAVMVTFDDGLDTVWTKGAEVLRRLGQTATAFIVPNWIGKPGYLTWKQVDDMMASGLFDIQSHTMNHRAMIAKTPADLPEMERELVESRAEIERRLPGHKCVHLCYPYGLGSEDGVRLSKQAGYVSNFWSRRLDRLMNAPGDDPFYIGRIKHDFIRRLPGGPRVSLASLVVQKLVRRIQGKEYA